MSRKGTGDTADEPELPLLSELEEVTGIILELEVDICCWPVGSPTRYRYGLKKIARVRFELDALERELVAERQANIEVNKLDAFDHPSRGGRAS